MEPTTKSGVALRFPPQSKEAIAAVSLDCGGNRRATPLWEPAINTHDAQRGSLPVFNSLWYYVDFALLASSRRGVFLREETQSAPGPPLRLPSAPRAASLRPSMPAPFSELRILSGNAHPGLAERICAEIGVRRGNATVTTFPDGESFVKINENIRGCDVFIVQPTCPPTNNHLMELLIMVDAAKRASAGRINAVIPFFGYARQDRKDQPRVPITAKLVANLLTAAGVQRVLAVDLHAAQIQGFFDIPVDHLYAAPVLVKHLRDNGLGTNAVVVSPDVGGIKMSDAYARALDCPLAIVAKRRISATVVEAHTLIGEVEGKDVLIIDDLTETAGTLTAAAELLRGKGARSIRAVVSHGVLGELGHRRLTESSVLEELICTDSTPQAQGPRVTTLSIASLLAEAIKRIHAGDSVTSLFEV